MKVIYDINKNVVLRVNLTICLVITLGFVCSAYMNYRSYGAVVRDDIENISKLTALGVYSRVDNDLTKPVFVSSTMAADTFLKKWLREEKELKDDPEHQRYLLEYLKALKKRYDYNSVFLVSSKSDVYYHFGGVHKVISPQNAHDVWYYDFLAMNKSWALDVDVDEADNNALTVFVNCRIEDGDGKLMGVVGVGIKMYHLQEMLRRYEQEFQLRAFLVDRNGVVQVHTDRSLIEKANLFTLLPVESLREDILGNLETPEMHWYPQELLDHCLITCYVKSMDWYLVVEKDTRVLQEAFFMKLKQDLAMAFILLLILLYVSTWLVSRFNKTVLEKATTDELTHLPNRQAFNLLFAEKLARLEHHGAETLFILDVDEFKRINDFGGHLYGDSVLVAVAQQLRGCLGESAYLARWGGDEFVGIMPLSQDESVRLLNDLSAAIQSEGRARNCVLTVSIGVTALKRDDTMDSALLRADDAMYRSKNKGHGLVTAAL